MDDLKIDKGIPLPRTPRIRKLMDSMEIGDSILVTKKESGTVYAYFARHGFGCTRLPEGEAVRCWKTIAIRGHGVERAAPSARMRRYELIALAHGLRRGDTAVVPTAQVGSLGPMIADMGFSYSDKPSDSKPGWSVVSVI